MSIVLVFLNVFALAATAGSASPTSPAALSLPDVPFESVESLSKIPLPVMNVLLPEFEPRVLETEGSGIADRGGKFNCCCSVDTTVPDRRLVVAAHATDLWVIVYQHGGSGLHQHAIIIDIGGAKPSIRSAWRPRGLEVKSVVDLVKAFKGGQVEFMAPGTMDRF